MCADSFIVFVYNFLTSQSDSSNVDEISHHKFIGMALWTIGFFLALFFAHNLSLVILSMVICDMTLVHLIILKSNSKKLP